MGSYIMVLKATDAQKFARNFLMGVMPIKIAIKFTQGPVQFSAL
jgi:hypothetical protein